MIKSQVNRKWVTRGFCEAKYINDRKGGISRLSIIDKMFLAVGRQLLSGCHQIDITPMGQMLIRGLNRQGTFGSLAARCA
jgi:hypothetical protein